VPLLALSRCRQGGGLQGGGGRRTPIEETPDDLGGCARKENESAPAPILKFFCVSGKSGEAHSTALPGDSDSGGAPHACFRGAASRSCTAAGELHAVEMDRAAWGAQLVPHAVLRVDSPTPRPILR
jgi:hypothetical protein